MHPCKHPIILADYDEGLSNQVFRFHGTILNCLEDSEGFEIAAAYCV